MCRWGGFTALHGYLPNETRSGIEDNVILRINVLKPKLITPILSAEVGGGGEGGRRRRRSWRRRRRRKEEEVEEEEECWSGAE